MTFRVSMHTGLSATAAEASKRAAVRRDARAAHGAEGVPLRPAARAGRASGYGTSWSMYVEVSTSCHMTGAALLST